MENYRSRPVVVNSDGRLADNIVYFARALRKAGMRVGPASVKDAIEAVLVAGIGSRDDFYWTLHSVLVTRREDHLVFDEAFRLFWKSRELIEKMLAMFSPVAPDNREKQKPRAAESRVADAMFEGHRKDQKPQEIPEIEVDARFTFSGNEVLRDKDFAQMTAREIADAKQAISELRLPFDHGGDAPLPAGSARPPRRSARHDARGAPDRRRSHPAEIPLAAGRCIRRWSCLPTFPAR